MQCQYFTRISQVIHPLSCSFSFRTHDNLALADAFKYITEHLILSSMFLGFKIRRHYLQVDVHIHWVWLPQDVAGLSNLCDESGDRYGCPYNPSSRKNLQDILCVGSLSVTFWMLNNCFHTSPFIVAVLFLLSFLIMILGSSHENSDWSSAVLTDTTLVINDIGPYD